MLLFADVFGNLRNMCLEIHELDLACFLTTSRLEWRAAFQRTKVILGLLTDIDMLLMVENQRRNMSRYSSIWES